jgi:hypothetical protein
MEVSPSWEANSQSANQKISRHLWNLNVRHRIHKRPPLVPSVSVMNPVHFPPHYYFNIYLNHLIYAKVLEVIIFLSIFWRKMCWISHLLHACFMPHQTRPPRRNHPNHIWRAEHIMEFLIEDFIRPPLTSPLLGQISCSASYAQTLSICVHSLLLETDFYTHVK